MNFLLQKLLKKGVMKHQCIAFSDQRLIDSIQASAPGRAIMHMGNSTRPGPFWAVHASDVPALQVEGYQIVRSVSD